MQMYQGVVEDLDDPLRLGRVRVRVFGLHTDDKSLIPTDALPWATVMMPSTSASMSGIGHSPCGLLPGSWVLVTFRDSTNQFPIVVGSTHGIPLDTSSQVASTGDAVEYTDSEAPVSQNVVKDGSGNTVKDSSGNPVTTTPPPEEPAKPSATNAKVIPSELGSISAKFESGGGDPGIINTALRNISLDGAAYGAYQLVSYLKSPGVPSSPNVTQAQIRNSPVRRYIQQSKYADEFAGLDPSSVEFDKKWKEIARRDRAGFFADQHLYAEKLYYHTIISKLPVSITNRGKAVHEALWSTSIQYGPSFAASIVKSAIGSLDPSVCDSKAVELLYDYKIANVKSHFKSSPSVWDLLTRNRFPKEKSDLIALASTYEPAGSCSGEVTVVEDKKVVYVEDQKKEVVPETKIVPRVEAADQRRPGERGFADPAKKYPLYFDEADTNRLSRGVLTGTIVEPKRSGVVIGREAGGVTISEPVTQFNAKYPFNKVFATPSGHIIEYDDTPGYERIHIYHRSGTFIEMHPDGKLVTKVRSTNTLVVNADDNTIVLGASNESVEGDKNVTVEGKLTLKVIGDAVVDIGGNATVNVTGNSNTNVTGTANIKAKKINLN